jgi:hypothetical protein
MDQQGETKGRALGNIKEAIEGYQSALKDDGLPDTPIISRQSSCRDQSIVQDVGRKPGHDVVKLTVCRG